MKKSSGCWESYYTHTSVSFVIRKKSVQRSVTHMKRNCKYDQSKIILKLKSYDVLLIGPRDRCFLWKNILQNMESYSEPCWSSKVELFVKILSSESWDLSQIFAKVLNTHLEHLWTAASGQSYGKSQWNVFHVTSTFTYFCMLKIEIILVFPNKLILCNNHVM